MKHKKTQIYFNLLNLSEQIKTLRFFNNTLLSKRKGHLQFNFKANKLQKIPLRFHRFKVNTTNSKKLYNHFIKNLAFIPTQHKS